jgi:hypothetical protein
MGYLADEACDVGSDTGSPASPNYGAVTGFTGWIEWGQRPTVQDRDGPTVKARHLEAAEKSSAHQGMAAIRAFLPSHRDPEGSRPVRGGLMRF